MISEASVKMYCVDDATKIKNYDKAVNDKKVLWHCHHLLEEKYTRKELIDARMYYYVPASELMFIPEKEHYKLHARINRTRKPHKPPKSRFPKSSPKVRKVKLIQIRDGINGNNIDVECDYCELSHEDFSES